MKGAIRKANGCPMLAVVDNRRRRIVTTGYDDGEKETRRRIRNDDDFSGVDDGGEGKFCGGEVVRQRMVLVVFRRSYGGKWEKGDTVGVLRGDAVEAVVQERSTGEREPPRFAPCSRFAPPGRAELTCNYADPDHRL
ncbi:hypothetical protein HAX54_002651 [Datura stramonium]|uniref:Uncharacterized protein n=1 Tax=Datura stramonium TaxID=4076 RepID=A0ABS8T4A1_DATST|nr:hypothetical protein [Datura stramonium]